MAEILIIDPDLVLGKIYTEGLQRAGHKARSTTNAQAAIHLIDELKPDVIVLELQLINHGGIEFLYELRSYPEWQSIPIVVQTLTPKNLFSDNTLQMKQLGVTQYLYKPSATLAQLNRAVKEALETVAI